MIELTHGSVFSGIGGFDLAAEWAGIRTLWQVEQDPFCQAVLAKHFPHAKRYGDIHDVKGKELERVAILSGGFPCQPFSVAGKQRGKADDRYLWPEMLRVIAEVRPTWVIAENVAGIIRMELDSVLASLESEGYTAWPLVIPACGVGARHRRNRVWIVGYSADVRRNGNPAFTGSTESSKEERRVREPERASDVANAERGGCRPPGFGRSVQRIFERRPNDASTTQESSDVAYAEILKNRRLQFTGVSSDFRASSQNVADSTDIRLQGFGAGWEQKPGTHEREELSVCSSGNGTIWAVEPDVGRVAHGIPRRVDRLKGLGNAIVPQVAYEIFKAIVEVEREIDRNTVESRAGEHVCS